MSNKTDALIDRRLRDLEPSDTVSNLQLFIDNDLTPAIAVIDGKWSFRYYPKPWDSSIGLHGDDGWLFYQNREDGVVINRIKNWKLPLPVGYFNQKINTLRERMKQFFTLVSI